MDRVSFFERTVITRPTFRYVLIHVHVCVILMGVPRDQKPAQNRFGQLLRGGENQPTLARFVRATASQGGGEIRKIFGGYKGAHS